ncbi:hypothetical protein SBA2_370044 [Acidobacteriia bacterium SbA2]|nr:hypothetical protein SBA2_370044 [Acidobacteriia bacterium SbA2]
MIIPPPALPELSRHHARGQEQSLILTSHGEDAVADFEVLEGAGLAVFDELSLVVNHDGSFSLARVVNLDLIFVDGDDGTENPLSSVPEALHFLRRDAANVLGYKLLVRVRLASNKNPVPRFQILKLDVLLSLAVVGVVIHHHGLRGTIHLFDFEAVYAYRSDRSGDRRACELTRRVLLRRFPFIRLLCERDTCYSKKDKPKGQSELFAHKPLPDF